MINRTGNSGAEQPAFVGWPLPAEQPPAWCDDVLHWWQDGRCGLCGNGKMPLVEDHDHDTGLVRGWLCRSCNSREGWALESEVPRIDAWRGGVTPAALLGVKVVYVNSQGLTPLR